MTEPFYSRYSQKGKDALGNPIGMPVPSGTDPAAVQTGRELGWKFVQAVPGRADQVAEFNEVQEILQDQIKDLGDYILRDGQTVGIQVRVDKTVTPARAYIEWQNPAVPGRVYAMGQFHRVPPQTVLTLANGFTGVGLETIAFRIVKRTVTEVEHSGLYDQIIGEENYGAPGAYRWVYDIIAVIKTEANRDQFPDSYDIWLLQDGEVRISSNDQLNEIDRNLINYTADLSGSCLVRGMRVRVEDKDVNTLRVLVDRGRAYVNGRAVGYNTTTEKSAPKAKTDVTLVNSEPITLLVKDITASEGSAPELQKQYSLVNSPIKIVSQLTLPVVIKKVGLVGDTFKVNIADPYEVYIPVNTPVYGPRVDIVSVRDLTGGGAGVAVSFVETPSGFRVTGSPLSGKNVEIVWVYNAVLNAGIDFNITSAGKYLDITRESYDYPATLQLSSNDSASYVYPGVGSVKLVETAAAGTNILKVASTTNLKVGQRLYVGNNRNPSSGVAAQQSNAAYDELVYIDEIIGTDIVLKSNLARAHTSADWAYGNKDYMGLDADMSGFVNYAWLLDRVDVVYIDQDNNIVIQTGQSNKPAYQPSIPQGVLPIAKLVIPANAEADRVAVEKFDVQRLDQQDLQKLLKRVERAEYNAAIQNLQLTSYTKASATGLNLRGIVTDPFVNTDIVDVINAPYLKDINGDTSINIDPDNGVLSPALDMFATTLSVDTGKTTCFAGSRSITLWHGITGSAVQNSAATGTEPIKGAAVGVKPTIVVDTPHNLLPITAKDTFEFFNVNTGAVESIPSKLEGGFWRHRQNDVPWLSQRNIYFPLTQLVLLGRNIPVGQGYRVVVDGYTVMSGNNPLVVTPPANGSINSTLNIPANTISGHNSRTVNLVNATTGAVVATTLIGANVSETAFLPVVNDSLSANPYVPVAQTFAFARDTYVKGVNINFSAVDAGGWVEVQLRNTDAQGQPGEKIFGRKLINGNQLTANTQAQFQFDGNNASNDPVFCEAGVTYAICFLSSSNNFVLKKAVVGDNGVASKPIASGNIYTSPDGLSWLVQNNASLVLQVLECEFDINKNLLVFNPVSTTATFEKFAYLLLRAQQLLPKTTRVSWSYSLDNELAETPIPVDVDGTLEPEAIAKLATPPLAQTVTFKARLFGTSQVSPQIGRLNPKMLVFNPKPKGVYKSRKVSGVSDYNSVRISFQLYTLSSEESVKLFFAPFGALDAYAKFTLTGNPKANDKLKLTIDGEAYETSPYAPSGTPSLAGFADMVQQWVESQTVFGLVKRVANGTSSYTFYIKRENNEALVAGDVLPLITKVDGTSTLTVSSVEYAYKAVTGTPVKQVVDTFYTEYTYELGSPELVVADTLHPDYALNEQPPKSFRVQLQLTTGSNLVLYPRVRNLSVIVASV